MLKRFFLKSWISTGGYRRIFQFRTHRFQHSKKKLFHLQSCSVDKEHITLFCGRLNGKSEKGTG